MAARACKEFGGQFCIVDTAPKCVTSAKPIDFIYMRKDDEFNIDEYESNNELIAKVQTGKGDETFIHYGYNNIYVQLVFAGSIPPILEQDLISGKNNLFSARAARYTYFLDSQIAEAGWSRDWLFDYHIHL